MRVRIIPFVALLALAPSALGEEKLKPAEVGKVKPLHVLGKVYLAGQPSRADLEAFKKLGVQVVINLREPSETDWDEESTVTGLGMEYLSLPFRRPAKLTDDYFDKAREALRAKDKKPVLLHCGSANRVGPIWIAHRVLDDKVPYDEAVAEAKKAGMRVSALQERARAYIRKHEKK